MTALSPQLHAIIGVLLRERLGLHYGVDERELLEGKLQDRARDAGFESLLDYYYHLRYDDPDGVELTALGDALVVNESYFFREHPQLQVIVRDVVTPVVAAGGRARVWSAASASGEEPLGLAMMLEANGLLDHTDLVASDLSSRALARAQEGRWSRRALRTDLEPALVERWLEVDDRTVRLKGELQRRITWHRLNLLDGDAVRARGQFHVILCRNVLIYFDDDTVRRVVASLADQLLPGGLLFVGISESLLRFRTPLECEERGGVFCYRRPL